MNGDGIDVYVWCVRYERTTYAHNSHASPHTPYEPTITIVPIAAKTLARVRSNRGGDDFDGITLNRASRAHVNVSHHHKIVRIRYVNCLRFVCVGY